MKRVLLFASLLAIAAAAVFWYMGGQIIPASGQQVHATLYDTDADGGIDLTAFAVGDLAVLWKWDREPDGRPELIAYDSVTGPEGRPAPTGRVTAWDYGADSVLDAGSVPEGLERRLRAPELVAQLTTPANQQIALVGIEIRALMDQIRSGYDEWRLAGFRMPIVGAGVPDANRLLPGAPRTYRHGTHQGFDMYPGHVGAPTGYGGPVVAAKDGTVTRADTVYTEMTNDEYQRAIASSSQEATTPADSLDLLRGRQVWIDHGHGVITRYCHLSGVSPELALGDSVDAGTIVGYVGNSGMEAATSGARSGAHLHFEMRIDGRYFGDGMTPDDLRAYTRRVFGLPDPE